MDVLKGVFFEKSEMFGCVAGWLYVAVGVGNIALIYFFFC